MSEPSFYQQRAASLKGASADVDFDANLTPESNVDAIVHEDAKTDDGKPESLSSCAQDKMLNADLRAFLSAF